MEGTEKNYKSKVTAIPNAAPEINCVQARCEILNTLNAKNEAINIQPTIINWPISIPILKAKRGCTTSASLPKSSRKKLENPKPCIKPKNRAKA